MRPVICLITPPLVRLKPDPTYEKEDLVRLKPDPTYEEEDLVRLKPDTTYEEEDLVRLKPDPTYEKEGLVRLKPDTPYEKEDSVRPKPDPAYVGSGFSRTRDDLIARIAAAARAGVHLIQIRQPGWDGRPLAELVAAALDAVRGTDARVLVNDRLDVALAMGAHGLHLRSDSPLPERVRAVAPRPFLIGRSVHAAKEAQAASGDGALDYVIFGTVFPTESKPGAPAAGLDGLAAVCAAVPVPVLAVGGMTAARLGAVARAGADGFAAIGLFSEPALESLDGIVSAARRAFDTPATVP
jgi:thiamine-phosphate pyrophosphorylase